MSSNRLLKFIIFLGILSSQSAIFLNIVYNLQVLLFKYQIIIFVKDQDKILIFRIKYRKQKNKKKFLILLILLKDQKLHNYAYYVLWFQNITNHLLKMMNIEMYTQMGFTQAQVKKAYQYSKKNKIDMFDALQQIQNRDYTEKQNKSMSNIPAYSFLNSIKNVNLNEYEVLYSRSGIKQNNYGRDQIREINTPVGLFNVSNCCYLNSLLQCYFLMGGFTREILQAEQMQDLPESSGIKNKRIQNQYLLLEVLKQIFSKMKMSSRRYLDPTPVLKNLVNSVGEKIEYGDEKDLNQINMEIVERLSECLMFTRKYYSKGEGSPSKIKKRQNIKSLFYGEKVEEIQGVQGQNISDFMGFILNPKHENILFALDEQLNYEVQIDGKMAKKHVYLRTLPKYLFLTISRIEYEKKKNQAYKNSEKIAFDFVVYLDQYLLQNREQTKIKGPKIRQLQNRKVILKSQQNHLNILAQKLQQCREHAKFLRNWEQKLPQKQDIQKQKLSLSKQIQQVEKSLEEVETRKEKFILMYIFVHRGNAISGHYWGYGKNGNYWYRFDVNCSPIRQADILIDIQKSSGIPYALVYAKDGQLESFAYPYYTNLVMSESLLNLSEEKQDYVNLIPSKLKNQIIEENVAMHESIERQKNKSTVESIVKEYKTKFNIVKSQTQRYSKIQTNSNIPLYINFACYLESIQQSQLMKYNVFSNAVFSKTQMSCQELIQDEPLLKSIQKSFRKKVKGKMTLKHFAIQCQPVQGTNYKISVQAYLSGKKCLEFTKFIWSNLKDWPKIENLTSNLDEITLVLKQETDAVYVKSITRQLVAIMLIDLALNGKQIKKDWIAGCDKKNPILSQQLQSLQVKYFISDGMKNNESALSQIKLEQDWSVLNLKKGFQCEFMGAVKEIINKLSKGVQIYKKNTKSKQIVKKIEEKKQEIDLI